MDVAQRHGEHDKTIGTSLEQRVESTSTQSERERNETQVHTIVTAIDSGNSTGRTGNVNDDTSTIRNGYT